jgi:hypothetical protein
MTYSDEIQAIDSVKAYYSGTVRGRGVAGVALKFQQDLYVELDIVLPGDTLLSKAHDISQSLQDQLETLPSVTRAFVHVDHEVRLAPVAYFPHLASAGLAYARAPQASVAATPAGSHISVDCDRSLRIICITTRLCSIL